MAIKRIMVIGAGQMGGGIAQVAAEAGLEVVLNDIDRTFIDNRLAFIGKLLDKNIAKGRISEDDKVAIMSRLIPSTDLADAAGVDFVVEAAVEKMEIKEKIFRTLDEVAAPGVILASNTSSLPITELAAVTGRPELVIGMHFMNPVPVMKLIEVIRGIATSDATYATVKELAEKMGKVPVEVNDYPGFISNRVLMPMINEAIYCIYEGVADAESIDTVMKLGMAHPMGPLTLADFIGLDTCLAIMEVLYEGFADSKYRPCPLLRKMVKAGWLGKKSGKGFFDYQNS
ncbi:3-hydroxybutyryl-CoA dehydrogenase [Geothermobacter hydrogeniphilus]|uniref:3-hydroxybutyryl-CoA dehydrogenase n=1 Tax=Geothermobacter hydrogeniphilus TaxID=1969733 RepID=A0A1X0XT81_9BACT|nr:3-hydroxybutyryl-CoA dehydrogenase [Geothermobacter hydrogeniphilus]ORJ56078.1 3-hydroxybutyryl-CoA dehydrogenase [Geothermobacter hydrogeniphilus]